MVTPSSKGGSEVSPSFWEASIIMRQNRRPDIGEWLDVNDGCENRKTSQGA